MSRPNGMLPRVLTHDVVGVGDPLVLVPGGLTGWLSWVPHQERLGDHHRVVRVQPIHNELGSAGEKGDPGYSGGVERESLRLTLDELGIERADLAGWSHGARSLIDFVLAHPDRVRSLALVEPPASWILRQLGETDEQMARVDGMMSQLWGREVTEDELARFLAQVGLLDEPDEARSHPAWEGWAGHRMALSWVPPDAVHPPRSAEQLATIRCQVLLVAGSRTAPWLRRVVDVLSERLPRARSVVLEGGHAAHIESIDRFLEELERHLHG